MQYCTEQPIGHVRFHPLERHGPFPTPSRYVPSYNGSLMLGSAGSCLRLRARWRRLLLLLALCNRVKASQQVVRLCHVQRVCQLLQH